MRHVRHTPDVGADADTTIVVPGADRVAHRWDDWCAVAINTAATQIMPMKARVAAG